MADDKQRTYPDIPLSQWWKIRSLFRNRLVDTVTIKYLTDALGVKEPSARGIYRNLQLLGFVDKEGKTTERANHWRVDDQYEQVCKDIMADIYPQGLLDAPVETADRRYLVNWFVRNTRVGENYAAKNATVFELLREADPNKAKDGKATVASAKAPDKTTRSARTAAAPVIPVAIAEPPVAPSNGIGRPQAEVKPEKPVIPERLVTPSVHIDIQIHIAPDAPSSQIEDIFSAIERHLYKQRSGE